jgi:hypothetical protein
MKSLAARTFLVLLVLGGRHFEASGQPGGKGAVFVAAPPMPFALTASDGAGLGLEAVSARVVIADPLAFTELRLDFANTEDRVREGRFRISLPAGAAISRFAMKIGDRWQEGEMVERQAARVAYEGFLHQRRDPALLEHEGGDQFSARVFPIAARGTTQLIVSYSQELAGAGARYRLPLRGLPRIGSLDVRATLGRPQDGDQLELVRQGWVPDRDFELDPRSARQGGVRHENLVVARVAPLGSDPLPHPIEGLFVLVDTSASRGPRFAEQQAALEALLGELARRWDPEVRVAVFDQDVEPLFRGRASAFRREASARLAGRQALGASDLERMLARVAETLQVGPRFRRVLLLTDALPTAGATAGNALRARVKALGRVGVERLDVLAVGGAEEGSAARLLATGNLVADGVVLDGTAGAALTLQRLTRPTHSGVKIEVEGARWSWPQVLDGVQPGDEVLVHADLPPGRPFRVKVAGQRLPEEPLGRMERPLLERAVARARIAQLLAQRDASGVTPARRERLREEVVALSLRERVLTPFTALVVLENEWDYARAGIERRATRDVVTVGDTGVEVQAPIRAAPSRTTGYQVDGFDAQARDYVEGVRVVERAPLVTTTTARVKEVYDLDLVESMPHDSRDRVFQQQVIERAPTVARGSSGPSFWERVKRFFRPAPARPPAPPRPSP